MVITLLQVETFISKVPFPLVTFTFSDCVSSCFQNTPKTLLVVQCLLSIRPDAAKNEPFGGRITDSWSCAKP